MSEDEIIEKDLQKEIETEKAEDRRRKEAERKQKEILKGLTDERLLQMWELTEEKKGPDEDEARGWIMDEIERRYPEKFEKWLDSDAPEDSELRRYILR